MYVCELQGVYIQDNIDFVRNFFSYHVGPGGKVQVVRLSSKRLYLLSCLACPILMTVQKSLVRKVSI